MEKAVSVISEWLSRSGDTTLWSWVITVVYASSIFLSICYIQKLKGKDEKTRRFLWICISFFLLAMGINKQLDFQTLLTIVGKSLARHQGWFEYRRVIQKYFTLSLLLCLIPLGFWVCIKSRKILQSSLVELAGVAILGFFAVIRAGALTHIGRAASLENRTTHIHGIELLGLIMILFALILHLRKRRREHTPDGDVSS